MGKYYCLIAGLPDITLDDTKITYSVADFKEETEPVLSVKDKENMHLFFLKYDNANLLSYLREASFAGFDERGVFSIDDIKEICELVKEERKIPSVLSVPKYFTNFIKSYYTRFEEDDEVPVYNTLWEDRLSSLYYNEAMKCKNKFLASWFELNLNIGNILVAQNCREYGLEKEDYIVGDNYIARILRSSHIRDIILGDSLDYITELIQVAEEKDLFTREKRLDALRWGWLEESIFYKTFDFESVMAYLLRLEMIERWVCLSKERGEKTFRDLVAEMKRGSSDALEKFKENNK